MSDLEKENIDKLLQAIRKVPPFVKGTPIDRDEFVVEFAEESYFENFKQDDYKMISLELFELLEDIERTELNNEIDNDALRSIIKQLTMNRFIYLSTEKVIELRRTRNTEI
jgi:hypothetical protein